MLIAMLQQHTTIAEINEPYVAHSVKGLNITF